MKVSSVRHTALQVPLPRLQHEATTVPGAAAGGSRGLGAALPATRGATSGKKPASLRRRVFIFKEGVKEDGCALGKRVHPPDLSLVTRHQ